MIFVQENFKEIFTFQFLHFQGNRGTRKARAVLIFIRTDDKSDAEIYNAKFVTSRAYDPCL